MTKTDALVVLGVYGAAHGLMLLCNGVYWDDWYIVLGSPDTIANLYRHYGLPMFGRYHAALNSLGIAGYRLVVFLSYLASALCLLAILGRVREIDRGTALVLVLFFAVFPSNSARISIMASRIEVCYALFFAGFWLLAVHLETRVLALRLAALAFLFASFLTPSLLVFYALVPAYVAYQARPELRSLRSSTALLLRNLDLVLLPLAFWALKLAYFQPYGEFRGYNRVTPESALQAFSFIDNAFYGGFVDPIVRSFQLLPEFIVSAAIAAVLVAMRLGSIDSAPSAGSLRQSRWFLLAGFVMFVLGVYPYLAVGKVPTPDDWDSRHQLLTPLGAAFMLVYLPRLLVPGRAQVLIHALLIGVFVAGNLQQWVAFQKDWYKQVALIENFRTSPEVERGTRFAIDDRTRDLDANWRHYRTYEYAGLFRTAFGDAKRSGRLRRDDEIGAGETALVVEHGELQLTTLEVLRLRVLEWSDAQEFRKSVRQAVRLSATPLP